MLKYENHHHHHQHFHYACAVISATLLLLFFTVTHYDNDVVLSPTLKEETEQTRQSIIYDEQSRPFSRSGYFFDHLSGAIRLGFNHKRSIQEWEADEDENDRVGSTAEDRSKAAFASDDLPVDKVYRSEASEVTDVEDLLFYRVSRPTKWWRPSWFPERSNTLIFNSGLEDLDEDPINNSMLHDPNTTF